VSRAHPIASCRNALHACVHPSPCVRLGSRVSGTVDHNGDRYVDGTRVPPRQLPREGQAFFFSFPGRLVLAQPCVARLS
jgi:hypothetical protein